MDLKIIEKKEEPLLSRTKIISEINFEAKTPSKKEVASKLASSLNAAENLIVVKNIYTEFGFKKANVTACLYKDEKEMKNIEIKPKKKDDAKAGEKPKAENKPEAKEEKPKASKEEKPKEQKAQEKPKEKADK